MQVGSGCELTRAERGDERWTERVVEHRREEASLHDTDGVQELLGRAERHLYRACVRINGDQLPAESVGRRRTGRTAGHDIPERTLSRHGVGCYHVTPAGPGLRA